MSANKLFRIGVACFLLGGAACLSGAAEDLVPEWEVGQQSISAQDLRVMVPPKAPEKLTIQEAATTALRHNVGFRRTMQHLLTARSAWWAARQRWDLALFGRVQRTRDDQTIDEWERGAAFSYFAVTGAIFSVTAELDSLESEETEQTLQATLRQPLLAGSRTASAAHEEVRRARNAYRSALLSFFVERQNLVERAVSTYFDAVRQQQLVEIQDFSVNLAEEAVKDAQLRLEAGLIPEIDLTRAQLRLAREQTSAVFQQQAMRDAMDRLLLLLGLEVGGMPNLVTTVSYEPKDVDMDNALAEALALRPELRLSDLFIENREAARRISRSQAMPSLDLFGGWRDIRDGAAARDWNVGLELSVPIASRRLREAELQAEWDLLVERQDREDLRQQIAAEVRSQVRAAEAARANVEIASQSLEVAKRSLHFAQRMVEEGLRTNRDLLDAQDDLTRSESSLVTSKINYCLAMIRLQRAIGRDIAQDLPTATLEETTTVPEETAAP